MEDHSKEDLVQVPESVRQVTQPYAQSVPKPEDIVRITKAYSNLFSNAPHAADMDAGSSAYPVPSAEEIVHIREVAARLIPAESVQVVSRTVVSSSPDAEELLRAISNAFGASGASDFSRAGEPADDALLALQHTLESKTAPSKTAFDASMRNETQSKSVWKAVYLALGIMIAVCLLLTLLIPGVWAGLFQ